MLNVNPEKKRLKLTHKKTLVNSDLPIITDYHTVARGMKLHGFVDHIGEFGLIIRFYNGVKGLAPLNRLEYVFAFFYNNPHFHYHSYAQIS